MKTKLLIVVLLTLLTCSCAISDLDRINTNIDRVQDDVTAVVENAQGADTIEVVQSAWDATRLWNPYWGFGSAAFLILEMLRKRKKVVA